VGEVRALQWGDLDSHLAMKGAPARTIQALQVTRASRRRWATCTSCRARRVRRSISWSETRVLLQRRCTGRGRLKK
jgi:hypothetical protein